MTRNAKKTLMILVFCLSTTGFATAASATGFRIYLDCHGDGGNPDWAHTKNKITIKAKINGVEEKVAAGSISKDLCKKDNGIRLDYPAFNWKLVDKIIISTNGKDCAFLDKVVLSDEKGNKKRTWQKDDNIGYCLSKEKDSSAYCKDGRAFSKWTLK